MQTVIITGGIGLIGAALTRHLLNKGYHVIILSRDPAIKNSIPGTEFARWDIKNRYLDPEALKKADHIIHLAGASIFSKRWTAAYKKEILESRIKGIELITDMLRKQPHNVKTFISASSIGYYGADTNDETSFSEKDGPGSDFLADVCRQWEESARAAAALGIRICLVRTGIVMSNEGGALKEMKRPLNFGVAAIIGSGHQVVSWIHIQDLVRIYAAAIEDPDMKGSYNAVAPVPVTNKALTLAIARKKRGSFFVPVHIPSFVVRLVYDGVGNETLKSIRVSPEKLRSAGFRFLYPTIDAALNELRQDGSGL